MTHSPMSQNRVRDAAEIAAMYLRTGFIECDQCGHEVSTEKTDALYELDAALTAPPASDASGAEEAVAEAINKARYVDEDGVARGLPYRPLSESGPTDRAYCTKLARAALAAAPTAPAQAPSRPVDAGGVEELKAAFIEGLCAGWDDAALATQAPDKASRPVGANGLLDTLEYIADLAEKPTYNSLEVGFRHSPLTASEEKHRLVECCEHIAQVARSALATTPTPPTPDSTGSAEAREDVPTCSAIEWLKGVRSSAEAEASSYVAGSGRAKMLREAAAILSAVLAPSAPSGDVPGEAPPQADSTGQGDGAPAIVKWLGERVEAAHRDSEAHPEGSGNRSFYFGQAIAYENALSFAENLPSQADAQTQEGGE